MPWLSIYSANSAEINCEPLSDARLSGRPCRENISSRLEMIFGAVWYYLVVATIVIPHHQDRVTAGKGFH